MAFSIPVVPGSFTIGLDSSDYGAHPGIKNAKMSRSQEDDVYHYHHNGGGDYNNSLRSERPRANTTEEKATRASLYKEYRETPNYSNSSSEDKAKSVAIVKKMNEFSEKVPNREKYDNERKKAERLNSVINSSKSIKPHTLYRGHQPGKHAEHLLSYKPGDVHTHSGIQSTSSRRKVAESFSRREGKKGATVEYHTKPGTRMFSMGNMMKKNKEPETAQYSEHEVLLPHNSKYAVTHVDHVNRHIKMESTEES